MPAGSPWKRKLLLSASCFWDRGVKAEKDALTGEELKKKEEGGRDKRRPWELTALHCTLTLMIPC